MARRRKRDFWDDIDDDVLSREKSGAQKDSEDQQDGYAGYDDDEGFRLTKCMPVKVIARILLCVAAVVTALSGYIFYKFVDDRYANGAYTTSYFESNGFSREYNASVEKLLDVLKAVEAENGADPERAAEMAAGVLGTNSNFSYYVMNEAGMLVLKSGDDAKSRIESSNHFLKISNTNSEFNVDSGVPTTGLNKNAWQAALDECTNAYQIYTAVDNNLSLQDSFYDSYINYQKLTEYFDIAKIAGIAAIVLFVILLVFCVLSTGMVKGYNGVKLSVFDKVFTEIALILILAVIGGLVYGLFYLLDHDVKFEKWLMIGDAALLYIVLIRGYFSLVRRIKSSTFITNSLIYKVCHGINVVLSKLPKVLKVIIIAILLIALNGALVYALLYMREFVVAGFPVVFIAAPLIFIIELIGFISCIFGGGNEYEAFEEHEEPAEAEHEAIPEDAGDWENVDFSQSVREAEQSSYEDHSDVKSATMENVRRRNMDKTMVLPTRDRSRMLDNLGFGDTQNIDVEAVRAAEKKAEKISVSAGDKTEILPVIHIPEDGAAEAADTASVLQPLPEKKEPEAAPAPVQKQSIEKAASAELDYVDFTQLNKDVRKRYRARLKERSIGVTLRAPEKPILLDIDKANAIKVLSIFFENIEQYAEEGSRVYIEMYSKDGKMIYLMKNTIRSDLKESTTTAMGSGLKEVKRIIQAEKGKFINSVEGDIYKVGLLLDAVNS